MMLDQKTMSIQKCEMISGERQNTQSLDLCVLILSMPFRKLNGAKANSLGWLFGHLSFLYVGVSSYEELMQYGFLDQLSTTVASTLRLPAIFLGGKTCCAFDCTPNVDTAIEDKIKDR